MTPPVDVTAPAGARRSAAEQREYERSRIAEHYEHHPEIVELVLDARLGYATGMFDDPHEDRRGHDALRPVVGRRRADLRGAALPPRRRRRLRTAQRLDARTLVVSDAFASLVDDEAASPRVLAAGGLVGARRPLGRAPTGRGWIHPQSAAERRRLHPPRFRCAARPGSRSTPPPARSSSSQAAAPRTRAASCTHTALSSRTSPRSAPRCPPARTRARSRGCRCTTTWAHRRPPAALQRLRGQHPLPAGLPLRPVSLAADDVRGPRDLHPGAALGLRHRDAARALGRSTRGWT